MSDSRMLRKNAEWFYGERQMQTKHISYTMIYIFQNKEHHRYIDLIIEMNIDKCVRECDETDITD